MRLINAAKYFDKDKVYDAYTAAFLFNGQTSSYDEHSSTGATARRRVMSTKAGTTAPGRNAVTINTETWIVGDNNLDGFKGSIIRKNYALKKTTGLLRLLTPAEACLNSAGTSFHAHKEYFKDMVNVLSDSEYDVMWNIFCPLNEAVLRGSFFIEGSKILRVRNAYKVQEGFTIAESDEFDTDAAQSVTFTSTAPRDTVTDIAPVTNITTTAIQTDSQKFYRFSTEAEDKLAPGDRTVFVAKSAVTPRVSSTFTMLGKKWQARAVVSEIDSWAIHARMA